MIVNESRTSTFIFVINQKNLHQRRYDIFLHSPVRRVNGSDMHKRRRSDAMSRGDCKRTIRSVSLSTNTLHFKVRLQIMGFNGTIAVWCGTARRPLQMWRSLTGSSDWIFPRYKEGMDGEYFSSFANSCWNPEFIHPFHSSQNTSSHLQVTAKGRNCRSMIISLINYLNA